MMVGGRPSFRLERELLLRQEEGGPVRLKGEERKNRVANLSLSPLQVENLLPCEEEKKFIILIRKKKA